MAEVMFNEGATRIAKYFSGEVVTSFLLRARLFVNNVTPINTNTFASFAGCTLVGYSDVDFSSGVWTGGAAAGEDDRAADPIFQVLAPYGGGTTIYGYIVFDGNTNIALWGDVFPAPFPVPSGGAVIAITLSEKVKIA